MENNTRADGAGRSRSPGSGSAPGEQELSPLPPARRLPLVLGGFPGEQASPQSNAGPSVPTSCVLIVPHFTCPQSQEGRQDSAQPWVPPFAVAQLQLSAPGTWASVPEETPPSSSRCRCHDARPVVLRPATPASDAAQNVPDKLCAATCDLLFFRTNKVPSSLKPIPMRRGARRPHHPATRGGSPFIRNLLSGDTAERGHRQELSERPMVERGGAPSEVPRCPRLPDPCPPPCTVAGLHLTFAVGASLSLKPSELALEFRKCPL